MITLPLTKGYVAILDDADAEAASAFKWTAFVTKRLVYAGRREGTKGKRKTVLLHRWLLDAPAGLDVDHINGNSLDNRRCNLRLATRSQNSMNSRVVSGAVPFRGVSFDRKTGKFRAFLRVCGAPTSLGYFSTAEAASAAYEAKRAQLMGQFAPGP